MSTAPTPAAEARIETPGNLFVVAAPSGAGKSSLVNALLELDSHLALSISHTTRAPRGQEQDGREYWFIEEPRFRAMVERGEFFEWAEVHGHLYGTPVVEVDEHVQRGRVVVLDVDVQGGASVRRARPDAVTVFVYPPSLEALRQRLGRRGTDGAETVEVRLRNAPGEMAQWTDYDYLVVSLKAEIERMREQVQNVE